MVPHGLLVATHEPTARVEDAVVFGLLCCISRHLGNVHISGVDKRVPILVNELLAHSMLFIVI